MVGPPSRELRKQRLFCFLGLSGGGFLFVPSLTKKWSDHMNTPLENKELKNPQGRRRSQRRREPFPSGGWH